MKPAFTHPRQALSHHVSGAIERGESVAIVEQRHASISPNDLKGYSANEVANLADLDRWSVRDEGNRRQLIAEKKIAALRAKLNAAEIELKEAHKIINAAEAAARL